MSGWFTRTMERIVGEPVGGYVRPPKPYRVSVEVDELDGTSLWYANPNRFETKQDATVFGMMVGQWGLVLAKGETVPPRRVLRTRIIDTREE